MSKVINKTISDEVLDKTMHVFWEKGYFNTSVDELIEATGFNRRAIYSYFGSKHDLFLAVLKRYRNEITPQFTAPLKNTAAGHTAIDDFFAQFADLNKSGMPKGCFLIATGSDSPSHDIEVAEFIRLFSDDLRALFQKCLSCAVDNQNLPTTVDIHTVADFLVVNVFGIMALHRTHAPIETIVNNITMIKHFIHTLK